MTGESTCERCGARFVGLHACGSPDSTAVGGGRGFSPLFTVGVVMLMISVAVIGGITINRMRSPAPAPQAPAAAGLPSPRLSLAPSSTGSPRLTPGTSDAPRPAPTGLLSPPPGPASAPPVDLGPLPDHPAAAFRERMLRGAESYRFDLTGSMEVGNERLTLEVSLDVAGADYEGTMKVNQERVRVTAELIVKDGVQYTRAPGGEWMREAERPGAMPGDLFNSIGAEGWSALEYVGPDTRDGDRLHHLQIPLVDWEKISESFLDGERAGGSIRTLNVDIWVTRDGRPRRAEIALDATVREGAVEVDMTYSFTYQISGYGDPIEIRAPEDFTDPDTPTS
jgi:hypothetical protein